jgi:hypothetical protein
MRAASAGRWRETGGCVALTDTNRAETNCAQRTSAKTSSAETTGQGQAPCNGRRRLVANLPLALVASVALPVSPARGALPPLPPSGEQRFRVYYGDMSRDMVVAEIDYRLQNGGDTYEVSTRGKAVGMVAIFYSGVLLQTSVGRVGDKGLLPERYSEKRGKRPERVIQFDHRRGKMIGLGTPPEVDLVPGTQDRLSVFYQVGLLARGNPDMLQRGRRFTMPLASMKEVDKASFLVAGEESVTTGRGRLDTVRLTVRNEADPDDPTIDVWLAPSLSLLPARIRVSEDDGKVIDQVLVPPA